MDGVAVQWSAEITGFSSHLSILRCRSASKLLHRFVVAIPLRRLPFEGIAAVRSTLQSATCYQPLRYQGLQEGTVSRSVSNHKFRPIHAGLYKEGELHLRSVIRSSHHCWAAERNDREAWLDCVRQVDREGGGAVGDHSADTIAAERRDAGARLVEQVLRLPGSHGKSAWICRVSSRPIVIVPVWRDVFAGPVLSTWRFSRSHWKTSARIMGSLTSWKRSHSSKVLGFAAHSLCWAPTDSRWERNDVLQGNYDDPEEKEKSGELKGKVFITRIPEKESDTGGANVSFRTWQVRHCESRHSRRAFKNAVCYKNESTTSTPSEVLLATHSTFPNSRTPKDTLHCAWVVNALQASSWRCQLDWRNSRVVEASKWWNMIWKRWIACCWAFCSTALIQL